MHGSDTAVCPQSSAQDTGESDKGVFPLWWHQLYPPCLGIADLHEVQYQADRAGMPRIPVWQLPD